MNIAQFLRRQAKERGLAKAVVMPMGRSASGRINYQHLTFEQLEQGSNYLAKQLLRLGVIKGTKVLMFIRPSLEFSLVAFALLKIGAVCVLIDPGMGKRNLLAAIKEVQPEILIAVPEVIRAKFFFPNVFASVRLTISTGSSSFLSRSLSLSALLPAPYYFDKTDLALEPVAPEDRAAIIFTSGGTGAPKGVIFTHGIFAYQIESLKNLFALSPSDIDMPAFPLFGLFTIAMGMQSVIPDMNPSSPVSVDPLKLIEGICDHGVSFAAGSPAIWEKVGQYCLANHIALPSIRCLVMFGAPVRYHLHEIFRKILPNGTTYTPYGATECLPVSFIAGRSLLDLGPSIDGKRGTCVGLPAPQTKIAVMKPRAEALSSEEEMELLSPFEVGEIVACGPQVTPAYYGRKEETSLAKIQGSDKRLWHRMGDMGYLDDIGRLWFCGRKAHRLITENGPLDSIPIEAPFLLHPEVKRAALIGLPGKKGLQRPALVIERKDGVERLPRNEAERFRQELRQLAIKNSSTAFIERFYLHGSFPVDTRHNIKIDRQKLGRLFATKERSHL